MKKIAIIITSLSVFLAACGNQPFISSNYQEIDTIENDLGDYGTVYQAEGKSVSQVAREIQKNAQPDHSSKKSEDEMFLLYPEDSPEEVVHIMKDDENPDNTIIEVVEEDFAENSYDFPLMETLGVLGVATALYGWNKSDSKTKKKRIGYKGYNKAFRNKSTTSIPANNVLPDEEDEDDEYTSTGSSSTTSTGTSSSNSGNPPTTGTSSNGGTSNVKKSSNSDGIRNGAAVRGGGPGTGK
ncbi:DUF4247 domain-containing protein [Peribacillus simplex]|uniref:DUF4247 domain-containing protein n=1 Tax=Peribacillus simplex TaxID=1478 RepID=A0A8B5Y558_9BACI|nr:DUF4247 domain-containing protein [Peribacillus simplex]MED3911886.1 DUF4247 domain-containing protein [Peribacillus simplex]TVX84157.1 DUF4247 domain-containing protein [Peribacillus simplex]CAH0323617.1 hypothetical protein SRABI84_05377 [Peribacillus simplex]